MRHEVMKSRVEVGVRNEVMKSRVEVGVRNEVMGRGGGCAMKSWVEVGGAP